MKNPMKRRRIDKMMSISNTLRIALIGQLPKDMDVPAVLSAYDRAVKNVRGTCYRIDNDFNGTGKERSKEGYCKDCVWMCVNANGTVRTCWCASRFYVSPTDSCDCWARGRSGNDGL